MIHSGLSQLLEDFILTLCKDVDTPRSLTVSLLVRNKEYEQLFSLKILPTEYCKGILKLKRLSPYPSSLCTWVKTHDAEDFFKDSSVTEFLRKLELDIGIDLEKECLESFLETEHQNKLTNDRLQKFVDHGPYGATDIALLPLIGDIRKEISDILGLLPKELDLKFGPGSTFNDTGRLTSIPDKMSSSSSITSSCRCLLPFWGVTAWGRNPDLVYNQPVTVHGNRFTTVPKSALKRRGICIEPSINLAFQLSVGTLIRNRLEKFGIKLVSGQSLHRYLARKGSIDGSLATIDLSSASDTICYNAVKLLFPPMWFELLDSLRSPKTLINGRWHLQEKFSSMGNGFTFELETLMFLAICTVISRRCTPVVPGKNVSVYGDDMIVPTEASQSVISCLTWFGFTPNLKKTFLSGEFRESCGGDFFSGVPVRAHNLKDDPHEPQHYIALANGIRRMSFGAGITPWFRPYLKRTWRRVIDCLPKAISRLRGPTDYGDLLIHDDKNWSFRETQDKRGFIRVYSPVFKSLNWEYWKPNVVFASALYGCPSSGVLLRGQSVTGYRLTWISCVMRESE